PLERRGTRTPVFAVAGHNGDVFCYRALAQQLGDDQPFFGLEPPGLDGRSEPLRRVEDLAAYFAEQMRAFQPGGPYILAGFCAGGTVAFVRPRTRPRSIPCWCDAPLSSAPRLRRFAATDRRRSRAA